MPGPSDRLRQPCQPALEAVEHGAVLHHQPDDGGEIGRLPPAVEIRLDRAEVAAEQYAPIEVRMPYGERRVRRSGVAGPERHAPGTFGNGEATLGKPGEPRVQQPTGEAIEGSHGERRSGCVKTGLPLSHSLRAFQWMAVITLTVIQG